MRYLAKNEASSILAQGWQYAIASHRPFIAAALLEEQKGFCAYTEKWLGGALESREIEHYYPKQDYQDRDRYEYWYVVCRWINGNKARKVEGTKDGKIKTHLPLPEPSDPGLQERITYDGEFFQAVDENDVEAENFLRWTGMNKESVVKARKDHLDRLKRDFESRGIQQKPDEIAAYLACKPWLREYATAINAAFPGCIRND